MRFGGAARVGLDAGRSSARLRVAHKLRVQATT